LDFFYRQAPKTSDGKNSASLAALPMTVNFIVKNSCLPPIVTDSLRYLESAKFSMRFSRPLC